jgi:predicted nucleic acid-binding protein
MKHVVLDASAVMIFFLDRPGAEKVEEQITLAMTGKRTLYMCVVNWGEVYYSVWRMKGREAAKHVAAGIAQLPLEIVDADYALTELAAGFKAEHKLPYADCFAAALAQTKRAELVTSDQDFSVVRKQIVVTMI